MKRFNSLILFSLLALGSFAHAQTANTTLLQQGKGVVVLDKRPLPKLTEPPETSRLASDALSDAFGLPVFVDVSGDGQKADDDILAGGEIGRIVNKLSIQGILPGQEALIESFVVPMGSSFAVKIKDSEVVLLHIQEISDKVIIFGWTKDDSTYRYKIPAKTADDIYLDDELPRKGKS